MNVAKRGRWAWQRGVGGRGKEESSMTPHSFTQEKEKYYGYQLTRDNNQSALSATTIT